MSRWAPVILGATLLFSGTLARVERANVVKLRELAEVAGCEKDAVRVALRWQGSPHPLEVEVWCEPAKETTR